MRKFGFYVIIVSFFLTGCMLGPNFHPPSPVGVHHYVNSPVLSKTTSEPAAGLSGKSQHFRWGKDVPADWWHLFHSKPINALVLMGLAHNPTVASAQAALKVAQENLNAQIGASLYPAVNALLFAERQRFSTASLGVGQTVNDVFNLYNASASVSYTLDIFGGLRRQIEALGAQVDYQQFLLEGTYLSLTANIVTTAITIASLQAQIAATYGLIYSQDRVLDIVTRQFHIGGASKADVLSQQTVLAQTRATLPPLQQQRAQKLHALSALIGEMPQDCPLPELVLDALTLPQDIPMSLPSLLARQRPDVRASEALLHAASAQIGVATANLFPQVTLTGNYGWQSLVLSRLFNPNAVYWAMMASLAQPIFAGGSLLAKRRAALANYRQALFQYHQTVLQAFQNVADSLRALEHDAQELKVQMHAEVASRGALRLVQQQYQLGGANYVALLNAQKQYQQSRIGRIKAQAARFADTAALFQALGGGWWDRKLCPQGPYCASLPEGAGT